MKTLTREQLTERIEKPQGQPPVLVEVLGSAAFDDHHLPHAINVPYGKDFVQRLADEVEDADTPIVVYGAASEPQVPLDAALSLEEAGYRRVSCYLDGKDGWRDAGPSPATESAQSRIGPDVKSVVAGVDTPFRGSLDR